MTETPTGGGQPDLRYGELDRDLLVNAVLRLAEGVPLQKITMRGVAAELGTSPGALYYHVRDRGDLLDLAAETVLSRVASSDVDSTWDLNLRSLYTNARREMLPVKGIAAVLQSRPVAPSGRRLHDISSAILKGAGFSPAAARAAKMALNAFLLGAVALEQALALEYSADDPANFLPMFRGRDFTAGLDIIIAGLKSRRDGA